MYLALVWHCYKRICYKYCICEVINKLEKHLPCVYLGLSHISAPTKINFMTKLSANRLDVQPTLHTCCPPPIPITQDL